MDMQEVQAMFGPIVVAPEDAKAPKTWVMTDNAEVVVACVLNDGVFGMGSAKRHPKDHFDYTVGRNLALARAYEDTSRMLKAHASNRGHMIGLGEVVRDEDVIRSPF